MKLRKPLPAGRDFEQVRNHYLVEKAIAERLKAASREERKIIYATMYDDLFKLVPDHPRLTHVASRESVLRSIRSKLLLVEGLIDRSTVFVEFAPGDCRFAVEVARYVKKVYGVDISCQSGRLDDPPDNFSLILYDGYNLEGIDENSIDIAFSDQLIEHFHPDDTGFHFRLVNRILKKGGRYVFRTPHPYSGPHDISQYFSDDPEGFHLKEWTHGALKRMLEDTGFRRIDGFWNARGMKLKMPSFYFSACETALKHLPGKCKRVISKYLIPQICIVAVK